MPTFINAGDFLSMLAVNRWVWLSGRPGSGKTSLAIALSAWLYDQQYVNYILANFDLYGRQYPVKLPIHKAAIILDEVWMLIRGQNAVADYAAATRKLAIWLILPSTLTPHYQLRNFRVWRWFNAFSVGIPTWIYRWQLIDATGNYSGYFAFWRPGRVFRFYDTREMPSGDDGIAYAIAESVRLLERGERNRHARKGAHVKSREEQYGAQTAPAGFPSNRSEIQSPDVIDAAEIIADAAEKIRKSSRKRR